MKDEKQSIEISSFRLHPSSFFLWGVNSVEECHPHTVEVIGSTPIRPTTFEG
jgi:hypothetical protein